MTGDGAPTAGTSGAVSRAEHEPDWGPGGYLPDRAARRARKIVLRAPMGIQWPLAAVAVAVLVALVGGWYLASAARPPSAPFAAVGPLDSVDPRAAQTLVVADAAADVVVVRGGGGLSVLRPPGGGVRWCDASRRLEADDGRVWDADGRRVSSAGASLIPLPSRVHDGIVYAAISTPGSPLPPVDRGETPSCG